MWNHLTHTLGWRITSGVKSRMHEVHSGEGWWLRSLLGVPSGGIVAYAIWTPLYFARSRMHHSDFNITYALLARDTWSYHGGFAMGLGKEKKVRCYGDVWRIIVYASEGDVTSWSFCRLGERYWVFVAFHRTTCINRINCLQWNIHTVPKKQVTFEVILPHPKRESTIRMQRERLHALVETVLYKARQ